MSFMRDGAFASKAVQLGRAHAATSLTSSPQDTLGFTHAVIEAHFGAVADTATVVINLASSATQGGSYVDITGVTYTVVAASDDNTTKLVGVISLSGVDRWLQAEATIGGSGNVTVVVSALLTNAKYTPDQAPAVSSGPTPAA